MAAVLVSGVPVLFGFHDCSKPNWLEPFPLTLVGLQEDRHKVQVSES